MKIDKTQEENWETQDPAHREVTGTSRVLERIAGILSYFGSSRCSEASSPKIDSIINKEMQVTELPSSSKPRHLAEKRTGVGGQIAVIIEQIAKASEMISTTSYSTLYSVIRYTKRVRSTVSGLRQEGYQDLLDPIANIIGQWPIPAASPRARPKGVRNRITSITGT
ncbi:predicted protein [Histoplasma capsulatum G186AR]|uniref:Uncharacterized protein n=1 Tax=Ajellomyces capsulatus (strain G186AR / H82 / ATCC MYA-2454 / RMSCC 2432) TaxID=447093 RepID=C0NKJ3_AJECG|nr:uncharacterized protein HCBG_03673 [Histoplasma capsulatum G186AR]EEH08384.1 predicted protein [Histoplasma capsulatum G186AR]